MSKKLSTKKVAEIVEIEGLGYAVQHYMNGDSIKDSELSKLWDDAKEALDKIENILSPYLP